MTISIEEVHKIGRLARLAIPAEKEKKYAAELSKILDLFAELAKVDTENVKPLAHPFETPQRLRDDIVTEENLREHFQANAPMTEAGLYIVPAVIE